MGKLNNKSGFKEYNHDVVVYEKISKHIKKYKITDLEIINNFLILTRRQNLKRFIMHLDLFKKSLNVPGDIIEFGVYRGLGLMTWANLLEIYCIGDRTKVVWGFDNWKGFTSISAKDGKPNKNSGKIKGGFNPKNFKEELLSAIEIFDFDRFVPWKKRIKLIDGDVEKEIKKFIKKVPGARFSLVHFDMDLYKPTKIALETIWPFIPKGGIVIFDEYSIHDWPGETKAVDEFLSKHPNQKLQSTTLTNTPAAWLEKK